MKLFTLAPLLALVLAAAAHQPPPPPSPHKDNRIEVHCIKDVRKFCHEHKNGFAFSDGCRMCKCLHEGKVDCNKGPCEKFLKEGSSVDKYCAEINEKNKKMYHEFMSAHKKGHHGKAPAHGRSPTLSRHGLTNSKPMELTPLDMKRFGEMMKEHRAAYDHEDDTKDKKHDEEEKKDEKWSPGKEPTYSDFVFGKNTDVFQELDKELGHEKNKKRKHLKEKKSGFHSDMDDFWGDLKYDKEPKAPKQRGPEEKHHGAPGPKHRGPKHHGPDMDHHRPGPHRGPKKSAVHGASGKPDDALAAHVGTATELGKLTENGLKATKDAKNIVMDKSVDSKKSVKTKSDDILDGPPKHKRGPRGPHGPGPRHGPGPKLGPHHGPGGPPHQGPRGPHHDGPHHDGPHHDGPPRDGPHHDGPPRDGPRGPPPPHHGPDGPPPPHHDGPGPRDGPHRGPPPHRRGPLGEANGIRDEQELEDDEDFNFSGPLDEKNDEEFAEGIVPTDDEPAAKQDLKKPNDLELLQEFETVLNQYEKEKVTAKTENATIANVDMAAAGNTTATLLTEVANVDGNSTAAATAAASAVVTEDAAAANTTAAADASTTDRPAVVGASGADEASMNLGETKVYLTQPNTPEFHEIVERFHQQKSLKDSFMRSLILENDFLRQQLRKTKAYLAKCEHYRGQMRSHLQQAFNAKAANTGSAEVSAKTTGFFTFICLLVGAAFWQQ